jgi:hypothetical protein
MVNTGSGGLEWIFILGFIGIVALGYYFLVVVPSREPRDPDDLDDSF